MGDPQPVKPGASWHVAFLTIRYDENGDRSKDRAWYRDPPTYVELGITPRRTEVALLHMWAREPNAWHGHMTYLERDPRDAGRWAPAPALRQLSAAPCNAWVESCAVTPKTLRSRRTVPLIEICTEALRSHRRQQAKSDCSPVRSG